MTFALIVVDLQNDFIAGSLALHRGPGGNSGEKVVDSVNRILEQFRFDLVIYTQDWHPLDHCSFETQGGKWPVHCVQNTGGAELHPKLNLKPAGCRVFFVKKATGSDYDSYSGFGNLDEDSSQHTEMKKILEDAKVDRVFLCGITTEYCVWQTADHSSRFFATYIIEDCCGSFHEPGAKSFDNKSVNWITSDELCSQLPLRAVGS